jgi:hypothetical protein
MPTVHASPSHTQPNAIKLSTLNANRDTAWTGMFCSAAKVRNLDILLVGAWFTQEKSTSELITNTHSMNHNLRNQLTGFTFRFEWKAGTTLLLV